MASTNSKLQYLQNLYVQYAGELRELTQKTKPLYDRFCANGWGATFSDVEAEVLYLLVRDQKPEIAFEISPDCGYSTHYILQAMTKNNKGKLYSFELSKTIRGISTEEAIRSVQLPDTDTSRLQLVLGDARVHVAKLNLNPDFVFLDSCHDDFFAEWYMQYLLPRCKGMALIHDIMYPGGVPEFSGESSYVQSVAFNTGLPLTHVGDLEIEFEKQREALGLIERRPYYAISTLVSDCKPLESISQLANEQEFVQFIQNAKHTQSIQDVQISPWKDADEAVTQSNIQSTTLSLTADLISKLTVIAPITLAQEFLSNKASKAQTVEVLGRIKDVFSRESFAVLLGIVSDLKIAEDEVNFENPIEVRAYLKSGGSQQNPAILKLVLNSEVPLYWRLKILEALKISQAQKTEQLEHLSTELLKSTIHNKRIALEILGVSKEGARLFAKLAPTFLDQAMRNQLSHRHLKQILNNCGAFINRELHQNIETAIQTSIRGRRKATLEIAVEYLFQGRLVKALSLYREGQYSPKDDVRFLKHHVKAKLKNTVRAFMG